MALRINHNIQALDAHRNLTNTERNMGVSMEKLSSGYRINRASDDPAGLVISEQFRAQIAGLNRAIQNSEGSINMIQTAEGALNEINSLLVGMRELAIHAANEGFNDTSQLEADQAEIQNALETIDRIASNTQFGTKKLIDGSKDNITSITSSNVSQLTLEDSRLKTGDHNVVATKVADATATLNTTNLGISLGTGGTGSPDNITHGKHDIEVTQASTGASKSTGTILIQDAFNNGIEFAAAAAAATLDSGVNMAAIVGGTSDGDYSMKIRYQENGESVSSYQTISTHLATGDATAAQITKWNAAIQANDVLRDKIEMVDGGAGVGIRIQAKNAGAEYSFEVSDASATVSGGPGSEEASFAGLMGLGTQSRRGVSEDQFTWTIQTEANSGQAVANIANGTYTTMTTLATAIRTGLDGAFGTLGAGSVAVDLDVQRVAGTNKLEFFTWDEGSAYSIKYDGEGGDAGDSQNVLNMTVDSTARTGTDALILFDGYTNSIDKVAYENTRPGVKLWNKDSTYTAEDGRGSITIDIAKASSGLDIGELILDVTATQFDVSLDGGAKTTVYAGEDTKVYNADRTQWAKVNYDLQSDGGSETVYAVDEALVFQIGGSVGQTATVNLRNMASSALGKNLAGNMFNNLSEIDVTTAQGAQDAQSVIDKAIDQVSTTRGAIGSFQKNTLESNLTNLRIAEQNLTASEASIRDTDMAKEMSNFVKNQILLQAGTSMLAQANQVPQVVLSLFQ